MESFQAMMKHMENKMEERMNRQFEMVQQIQTTMQLDMQNQRGIIQTMIESTISQYVAAGHNVVQDDNMREMEPILEDPDLQNTRDMLDQDEFGRDFTAQGSQQGMFKNSTIIAERETHAMDISQISDVSTIFSGTIHTTRRVFVIGESHLGAHHFCNLKERLEEAGVGVAMYEVIGGGTYQDTKFETAIVQATQEAREDDVILIVMGSNDSRNIARGGRPDTLEIIRAVLTQLAKEAAEKKFQLLVTTPLPSPCYGSPGSKQWCERVGEEPCEHEHQYRLASEDINQITSEAMATSVAHAKTIPLWSKFVSSKTKTVKRQRFVPNDIHLNSEGGDLLSQLLFSRVRRNLV